MIRLLLFVILMYGCLADTVQQIAAKYTGGKRDFGTVGYNAGMSTETAKRFAEGNFECPAWVRKSERISSDSPCCWADESWRVGAKNGKAVTNHWGRYRKPKSDDCERCDNGNLLSGNCDICNVETACNYNSVSGAVNVQSNSLFAAMQDQPCLYPSKPCDTCKDRDSNTIKDNDDDGDGICDAQDTDCAVSTACNYNEPGPCVYKTGCETCNTIGWNDDDLDGTCNVDELVGNNLGKVYSVDWYGDKIASGSKDNTVRVWDSTVLDSNALIKTLTGHGDDVLSVSFSPDGLYIVSGSKDKTVRVWNIETGEQIRKFVHDDPVRSVDWYGGKIVSGSEDKTVRVWNVTSGNLLWTSTHSNWVLSVSWSPDGRYVASGSRDHNIYVWDTVTGDFIKGLYGHDGWVNSVSWSPDGTYIVSGSEDQIVKVWNVTSGERVKGIIRHTSGVESVSFSPDGSHIVSGSSDKYIYIYNWDGTSHTLNATLEGEDTGEFLSLDWSSDGTKLVSGGGSVVYGSDDVRVWEWEQGVHSKLLFDDHIIKDDAACGTKYRGTKYPNARLCEVCDRTLDNDEDLVCNEDEIRGCTDSTAMNYNPDATNSASCTYPASGKDIYGNTKYTHRQVYVEDKTSFVLQETSTTFQCKSSRSDCTACAYCDASCTYNGQWKTVKTGEHANGFNKYKYMCACNQGYGGNYCQYHEKCNYRGEYEETTEDSMYKGGRCYCNRDIKGSQEQYGGTHCEKPATCWGYNEECYGGTCVLHSDPECKWNSGDGMYWTSKKYYNGFEKLNQQWKNECEFNTCRCDTGWTGKYCAEQTCDKCVHGRCHRTNEFEHNVRNLQVKTYDTMCVCNWGWGGEHCDKETNPKLFNHGHAGECFEGYSGDQCTKCSNCNGQTCHENSNITGYRGGSNDNFYVVNDIRVYDDNAENSVTNRTCTCSNGKTPISRCYCEKNQCNGHGYCDAGTDGHCVCDKGWLGEYCTGQGICADDGCTCQLDDTDEPNRPGCREEDCTYTPGTAVFGSDPVMECTKCKLGFTNNATVRTAATYEHDACDPFTSPCCNDNACESSLCPENSTCIGWKKNNKENIQCSDHSKTTETSCLAPKGVWTPACSISYISNQAECVSTSANTWTNEGEFLFVCSDPQFMDETSCLVPKGTWDSTCSISHISNHAKCVSTSVNTWDTSKAIALGTYTCGCYPRLTGDNCDIDCCERNDPVTNTGFLGAKVNGVCKQTVGGCRCDDGYEGYHCQCSDALCVNGHCNPKVENENFDSTVDGAMCICYPGYQVNQTTGVCDVDIDECAVTSCDHGVCEDGPCVYGKCRDGPGSFECKCKVGYIGDRCQDSTGWKTGATTCEDNKYLVEERCLDCPVGTYSNDVADTQCRVKLNDLNIRDAVSNTSHEYYGDIEDFDTSEVTNMDELFMNRAVPDISKWDVSAVTSMRNMFAGSTGTFAKWTIDQTVDITNIYAGSDMQDAEGKNWIQAYPPCDGTNIKCMHNGLLCVSGVIVYDTCKVDSQALETMVGEWEAGATKSDVLYGPLKDWDVHYVTDMTTLFTSGNPDIRQWDMSNVVHADGMLFASSFNHPVDNKDFSSLQTAKLMFPQGYSYRKCGKHFARARANVPVNERFGEYGKCLTTIGNNNIYAAVEGWFAGTIDSSKYGDMPDWDVSEVISMVDLFMNKINIPSLAKWDTGKVTSMKGMFQLSDFNEDIRHWDVRKVTTFEQMFKGNTHFAVDLTSWELHIGDTDKMFMGNGYYFPGTTAFNIDNTLPTALDDGTFPGAITGWFGDDKTGTLDTYGNISDWLTYKVTNMKEAFLNQQFNGDISRWVVSSVTDMSSMFEGSTFNGDISTWEVVNVENMKSMFKNSSFNQMIDRWNVSSVTDMSYMFQDTDFSRPIDSWDLFGTEPLEARAPGGPTYCIKTEGKVVDVVGLVGRAARRKCFDECTNVYPFFLPDIEGRSRNRSGGRVGGAYTPYLGGFGEVTSQNYNHTCMCIDEKAVCGTEYDPVPPFDYVYEYLDLDTTGMFDNNEAFVQPLCGLGWRYRDLDSLSKHQKQVSFTCDICAKGQHMSECGLCMGEFRFDKCMDSTRGYTLSELHQINPNLLLDNGIVLNSDSKITATTKVNPYACNCKYEGGLRGCLVVNGRKQVRIKEWYVWGEEDFSGHITDHSNDDTEYYCEVDFLDGREVATAKGFNSVTCTEDTLLTREECGLVGGNWDGQCDKCLEPCDPPELGVKFFSHNRECEVCDAGKTVFQNECVFCPDGQFTSEDYAYCGKCPMGTFGEDGDCTTCDYGKASTFEGAVRCDTCPNDHYSVGTSCEDCLTGKTSEAGDRTCKDKAHCWRGNTTENLGVGNYCSACEEGFELVDNTCVSKCKGDLVKQGETLTCTRSGDGGRWTGDNMDDCPADNDFRYMGLCADRPCTQARVTDCLCGGSGGTIVKNNETEACYIDEEVNLCYNSVISNCLCDMGGEYIWVSDRSCWGFCSSPDIIVESTCESTSVNTWTGGCSDSSLKTEEACLVMGSMVQTCSNGATIADCGNTSNTWDVTTGCSDPQYTDNDNCTANVGVIYDKCDIPDIYTIAGCVTTIKNTWDGLCSDARYLSQVTCEEEKHVWGDKRILDDCPSNMIPGQPCTGSSIQDTCSGGMNTAAKCAGFQCTPEDFVDGGDCCSAETFSNITECMLDGVYVNLATQMIYDSVIHPKCGGTTLENCYASPWTMHDVLIDCHGHECPQNHHVVVGNHCVGFGCDFDASCCDWNQQCSDRRCSDRDGYKVADINPDTYASTAVFTGEFEVTCCDYDQMCNSTGFSCTFLADDFCDGDCTQTDFQPTEDSKSTCCTDASWHCESGTCPEGWLVNTEYCGEKCSDYAATFTGVKELVDVELNGRAVECSKTLQAGNTSIEICSNACSDFFQMIGDKCYCTDTGPCAGPKADCSDWCTSLANVSMREFPFFAAASSIKDYVVCEHRVNGTCPEGWETQAFVSGGYTRHGCLYGYTSDYYGETRRHSSAGDCYESGTCCSVSYQSYEKRELNQRSSTTCCDIDTSKDVCEKYDCPHGYKYVDEYGTKFFETHAFDCCVKIPDTHYCDIFNSGTPYDCIGKYNHSALYCNGECSEETCCTPNNHFCDSITCAETEAATGVDYCGGVCTDQCCQEKPMCDRSYNCKENVDWNSRIDWTRYCDVADNEVCASSEYELGKCCTTSTTSCYQDIRFNESVSDTVHYQGSEPYYVGNQMPNCDSYGGHISYYEKYGRTGGSFTAESFAILCCNYVEVCPEQHTCENIDGSPSFLKAKFKDNVPRYCASGSYSYWDRIQGCDNNYSECCERETCGSASNRLGEYCNEPLVSWSQYWDIYLQELLTSDNFFSTCCQS